LFLSDTKLFSSDTNLLSSDTQLLSADTKPVGQQKLKSFNFVAGGKVCVGLPKYLSDDPNICRTTQNFVSCKQALGGFAHQYCKTAVSSQGCFVQCYEFVHDLLFPRIFMCCY
jgi:hypothetical protein